MIRAYIAWADEFDTSKIVSSEIELYRSHGKLWHKGKPVWVDRPIREDNEVCVYNFNRVLAENKLVEEIFKCQTK